MYILITLLFLCLVFFVKNTKRIFNIIGVVTIASSFFTLLIGGVVTYFLKNKLNFINISKINDMIIRKFLYNSLVLLIFGITSLTINLFLKRYSNNLK